MQTGRFTRNILSSLGAGLILLFAACAANAQPDPSPGPTKIAEITEAMERQQVTLTGTIAAYRAPASDRAPHSLSLNDGTGVIRVVIWQTIWSQIEFRDQLAPGTKVTINAQIKNFQGALEAHINRKTDIALTKVDPNATRAPGRGGAAATTSEPQIRVVSADPISWSRDLSQAMQRATLENRRILVFFENPEAEISRHLDTRVFSDMQVRARMLEKFIAVRINVREQAAIANKLGVFKAGVIGIYRADGRAEKQLTSIYTAEDLLREFRN